MTVAIVTGGTSGLGASIAAMLRERGLRVVTVSRREEADVSGDASREDTVARAVAYAESLGDITLLVNCAGAGCFGAAGSYVEEDVRQVIDANLVSMILFCDELFPRFTRDGGTIVNVLSTAALVAKPNESVYCAAKWGARGYTEVLKAEAKGTKARVLSVAPGGMQTPFWEHPREGFMDPNEVARVVVDAIFARVNVSHVVIDR
ncbi:MAG TPA: SDR family oxidoreductase [Thermoanaerobaculia bacterium]|nr:SDR family oxidoreductase [Thermoanaerobaculia bacterium]